jgi:flagellar basal-body rod modification protein FlgD
MTTVNPTSSASGASGAASSTSNAAPNVDYNAFLQLLVQEMKNQDPTSPSDPTQYLSQIASFSNVEQSVQSNNKLATLLTSSALTQAETAIGKTITSADGSVSGVVKSVALGSDGSAKATLTNGGTLTLDNTIQVSGS